MTRLLYTVKEVAELSRVTIKTLHYYHKIGLLLPHKISESGYRLYGVSELERLQQILFYRELDFPLEAIKQMLEDEDSRLSVLANQKELLISRRDRLKTLIQTIDKSIDFSSRGEVMNEMDMFNGFSSENEWREALKEQNEHLKKTYGYDLLQDNPELNIETLNEKAMEAKHFMQSLAIELKAGTKYNDAKVRDLIHSHLQFLNQHGHDIREQDFANQARFFIQDDFHRHMLESQQIGLAYYLCTAAESFANECNS